jgi:hypothetical protein
MTTAAQLICTSACTIKDAAGHNLAVWCLLSGSSLCSFARQFVSLFSTARIILPGNDSTRVQFLFLQNNWMTIDILFVDATAERKKKPPDFRRGVAFRFSGAVADRVEIG